MHPCPLQGDNLSGPRVLVVSESQAETLIRSKDHGLSPHLTLSRKRVWSFSYENDQG